MLMRVELRGQRLITEVLLRKDGGNVGYIVDMRTCVGMEERVYTGDDLGNGWL